VGWSHSWGQLQAERGRKLNKLLPFRSVLIFGGAGFIGSNLAHHLLQQKDVRVHIFDNLSRQGVQHNLRNLERTALGNDRLRVTVGDVRNAGLVENAVQSATEIYHFAAQVAVTTSIESPLMDFEVNAGGTLNILEAARKTGRKPFLLFTSTNKVYGHLQSYKLLRGRQRYTCPEIRGVNETQPLDFYSPYGCSKGTADQYVRDYARIYGLPTVVFRMSCIAGARQFGNEDQGWVAHFLYSAMDGKRLTIYGDGYQVRDVLCVEDLMNAFQAVRSNASSTAGEVYNVGGGPGNSVSLLELIAQVEKITGREVHYKFEPARPGDQLFYVTDFSKLRQHTGWRPRLNVRETLMAIQDWRKRYTKSLAPATSAIPVTSPMLERLPGVAS
jgi:CDP-paratose 2-epimerase